MSRARKDPRDLAGCTLAGRSLPLLGLHHIEFALVFALNYGAVLHRAQEHMIPTTYIAIWL